LIVTLGRNLSCDVVIGADSVSGNHAQLEILPGGVTLTDLGSRNGTFVNDERVSTCELSPQDKVRLGLFVFRWTGEYLEHLDGKVLWSPLHALRVEQLPQTGKIGRKRLVLWGSSVAVVVVLLITSLVLVAKERQPIGVEQLARGTAYIEVKDSDGMVCWTGSGAFLEDGLVLTNAHVAGTSFADGDEHTACKTVEVSVVSDISEKPTRFVEAEVVADDPGLDLAVLRVRKGKLVGSNGLKLAPDNLDLNEEVRVFGFPGTGGDTLTLSTGVIAGFQEDSDGKFYKVTAKISPGSSGGPMVDERGNLVGISTAMNQAGIECNDEDCAVAGESFGLVRPIRYATSLLDEVRSQKK
jgi:S1-C subfamily serine protease